MKRWREKLDAHDVRTVVCLGDSITFAPTMAEIGVTEPWADQLTAGLECSMGPRVGDGFQGLWRDNEWSESGTWTQPQTTDPFDVAPFRRALYSSGLDADELVWTRPATSTVRAFDLYAFRMPGVGRWQYRVDDGAWTSIPEEHQGRDDGLHRYRINQPVAERVAIRGHDGTTPCVAPIAGIAVYARSARGMVVHNLGHQQQALSQFCRPSVGDPLTLLDDFAPDLVTVLFSNDVILRDPDRYARALKTLVTRVAPYADVLIILPFEQRTHRCVCDATTVAGSPALTSQTALFLPTDVGKPVRGSNIAAGARIARVNSTWHATMTAAATGSSSRGELVVASLRPATAQAVYRAFGKAAAESVGSPILDLHDEWTEAFGPGWDAAYAAGLMHDGLHPSQNGHNDIATRVTRALGI
jgi:hypothetical protein